MCEITSGYSSACDESGGIKTWYAFPLKNDFGVSNIATLTVLDGSVTALTLVSGKFAYPFIVESETSSFTETSVGEKANKAFGIEQSGTIVMHGNTAEMIVQKEQLIRGRHVFIYALNDGTYEVAGLENGIKCNYERATGTAFEDMNGNTLTAVGKERKPAPKISEAIVLALLD